MELGHGKGSGAAAGLRSTRAVPLVVRRSKLTTEFVRRGRPDQYLRLPNFATARQSRLLAAITAKKVRAR